MQIVQDALFPPSDLKTEGYAQPEPRDEVEETGEAEIEDAA
ncbi:hypothetical protein ACFYVK_35045 [Streptomyces chartreusis]